MGDPGDLGHLTGFVVRRDLGCLPLLPHGNEYEPQQHGVGYAQDCVDEAGDVVVLLAHPDRYHALHQDQPADGEQHGQADQKEACEDVDSANLLPLLLGFPTGSKIHPRR